MLMAKPADRGWTQAAIALGSLVFALVAFDIFVWHPGFASGDETDIIALVQRMREGASWEMGAGFIHRTLIWASMSLWPGQLWATSVPALAALALEAALLFAIGRRLGGPRAGFFTLLAGLLAAFTLVRARSGLSYALFSAEWLILVWLRIRCQRPWAWALWGCALGFLAFEYEAFIPTVVLLLLLPFPEKVTLRQRAWELGGVLLVLLASFDPATLVQYFARRKAASLAQAGTPSAGLAGIGGLVFGGPAMPYLAPIDHGVFPPWYWLCLPLGLSLWGRRFWQPMAYVVLGVSLPLMGGAPYGLPAHRFIAAWPALALLTGLGLDRLASLAHTRFLRVGLALALGMLLSLELVAWARNQVIMDAPFRGPVRDLKRAADMAWIESQRSSLPLVTELHPTQGALFRFLTGHSVPPAPPKADKVIAFVHWTYLPAIRKNYGEVATFQEQAGYPPVFVTKLSGTLAAQALEAEAKFRPLLISPAGHQELVSDRLLNWLRQNPRSGPWARTLAVHYLIRLGVNLGSLEQAWIEDTLKETLLCAQPLVLVAEALQRVDAAKALYAAKKARHVDPYYAKAWELEIDLLDSVGRKEEGDRLRLQRQPLLDKGLLYND